MITVTTTDPSATTTPLRGTRRTHDYHCAGCGYRIVVRELPASCPICRATVWELATTKPTMSDDVALLRSSRVRALLADDAVGPLE